VGLHLHKELVGSGRVGKHIVCTALDALHEGCDLFGVVLDEGLIADEQDLTGQD
jgi:hypothetical protein